MRSGGLGATCETSECSEDSSDHLDSTKTVVEFIKVKNRKEKSPHKLLSMMLSFIVTKQKMKAEGKHLDAPIMIVKNAGVGSQQLK